MVDEWDNVTIMILITETKNKPSCAMVLCIQTDHIHTYIMNIYNNYGYKQPHAISEPHLSTLDMAQMIWIGESDEA